MTVQAAIKQKRASTGRARTAGGGKEGVTPERIAHAALEIIDEKGLDGLSMRELGQRLGCAHTAIYWYFRNREEVLKAVLDLAILKKEFSQPTTGSWDERARAICVFMRTALMRHPALPLLVDRFSGRGMTPIMLSLCAALEEGGLRKPESVAACRLLMRLILGFSTDNGAVQRSVERAKRRAEMLSHVNTDDEVEFVLTYAGSNTDELFDAAIAMVIGQIETARTIFPPGAARAS